LANTLTGRILTTTSPGWWDDVGNFDPTPGEASVNVPSCRSLSRCLAYPLMRKGGYGHMGERSQARSLTFALGRFASPGREPQVTSFKVRAQGAEGQ
jgi:hypothetical protein